jgi:hypothetical protein
MMNVVEFKPRTKIVNESVVELLEHWLEMAKSGEVDTVAIAGLISDGSSISQASEVGHVQALLGALRILEMRIVREAIEFE